jgi:hypothetical protein
MLSKRQLMPTALLWPLICTHLFSVEGPKAPLAPRTAQRATEAYDRRDFERAAELFQQAASQASREGLKRERAQYLSNLFSLQGALGRYAEASTTLEAAMRAARAAQDPRTHLALLLTGASHQTVFGNTRLAEARLNAAAQLVARNPDLARFRAQLWFGQGANLAASGNHKAALPLLERAAQEGIRLGIQEGERVTFQSLALAGRCYAEIRDWAGLARSVETAKRVAALWSRPVPPPVWRNEALLAADKGDFQKALMLLDNTANAGDSGLPLTQLTRSRLRGLFRLRSGDPGGLADLRNAVDQARLRRPLAAALAVGPDAFERELSVTYREYLDALLRLAPSDSVTDAWEAIDRLEEYRARALTSVRLGQPNRNGFPPEYWNVLGDLRRIEGKEGSEWDLKRSALLAELDALERRALGAGYENQYPVSFKARELQRRLTSQDLLLVLLNLSEKNFTLIALTYGQTKIVRLGPPSALAREAKSFRQQIEGGSPGVPASAERLFVQLFASLPKEFLEKRQWWVVPDEPLFSVPMAALRKPTSQGGGYLVESATIRLLPRLNGWFRTPPHQPFARLAAFADPIYNAADTRRVVKVAARQSLPRLVGSGAEALEVARLWRSSGRQAVLFTGDTVSREALFEQGATPGAARG